MILAQHAPYDFDTILERHGSSSAKWHEVVEQMGEDGKDVVPLSVADMEFKPAPEVVEALIQSATHDVFGYDYATEDYFTAFLNWMEHRHNFHIDFMGEPVRRRDACRQHGPAIRHPTGR